MLNLNSTQRPSLEAQIASILAGMNRTCAGSCIVINQVNAISPNVQYFVSLNVSLNATERIQLINAFFDNNVTLNSSYALTIQMIINTQTKDLSSFHSDCAVQPSKPHACFYRDLHSKRSTL